jgi:hypothetical protein
LDPDYCVDSRFRGANERVGLERCTKDTPGANGEQNFALTWRKVKYAATKAARKNFIKRDIKGHSLTEVADFVSFGANCRKHESFSK